MAAAPGRRRLTGLFGALVGLAAVALLPAPRAAAQAAPERQDVLRGLRARAAAGKRAVSAARATAARARAVRLLQLYVRRGVRRPHVGEQVTRLLTGRVQQSRQLVKHAGPGRERIEYLGPPAMRGQVLLLAGGRLYRSNPGTGRVLQSPAPPDRLQGNLIRLLEDVRQGRIDVALVGRQRVANREAGIIEVRPAARDEAPFKRLWIDEATGVRLRTEDVGASGDVVSTTYFTRIDLEPRLDPAEFAPASLRGSVSSPAAGAFEVPSVADAEREVGYRLREPDLPTGYRPDSVWVTGRQRGRQVVAVRYTDGVNAFTLFQRPAPRTADGPGLLFGRGKLSQWVSRNRAYAIAGALRPDVLEQIRASLR